MVVTTATLIPEYGDLTVPEINLSSPALKAGAFHFGKYCDFPCKEFMLCQSEEKDPRKCLREGKDVTKCGLEFFNKVRQNCMEEFTSFWKCLDVYSQDLDMSQCRKSQNIYYSCMKDKLGMDRPEVGYFSKIRIHDTQRPKPKLKDVELPEAAPSPPNVDEHPDPPTMKIPGSKWI